MHTKKILILGAGGILGNLIHDNLSKKFNVYGFSHRFIKSKKILKVNYNQISKFQKKIIQSADIIINCIGENSDEKKMYKKNVSIMNLISEKINYFYTEKLFIHLSTCGVYGLQYQNKISEKVTPLPNTLYSKTKLFGEEIFLKNLNKNIKIIILRSSQVIGKNMRNISLNKLSYFLKKNFFFFINNKNLDFSYIFADDLILSIELLINKKKYVTSIYNISNNIKYLKLVNIILRMQKKKSFIPNINPTLIKILIYLLEKLKIKTPLNSQSFNSLRSKNTFLSKKIKKELRIKNFLNINNKTIKNLIHD